MSTRRCSSLGVRSDDDELVDDGQSDGIAERGVAGAAQMKMPVEDHPASISLNRD